MKKGVFAFVTVCAVAMATRQVSAQVVLVHLRATQGDSGFVDADSKRRSDSLEDLRTELMKNKAITVWAMTAAEADIVTSVTSSRYELTGGVETRVRERPEILGGGVVAETDKKDRPTVRVLLQVGDYKKEFVGGADIAWSSAARDVARQINTWVSDNHEQLMSRRKQ